MMVAVLLGPGAQAGAQAPAAVFHPGFAPQSPSDYPHQDSFRGTIAYDDSIGRLVVFEEANNPGPHTLYWTGTTWVRQHPATEPSVRYGASMAYDRAHKNLVMFGGRNLNETWTYDGTTWTLQHPATSPPVSEGSSMVYDDTIGKTVLFHVDGSTWTYDGTNWTNLNLKVGPGPRFDAAMAYDAVTGQVVLLGGSNGPVMDGAGNTNQNPLTDTWIFNGSTWSQANPAYVPQGRWQAGVTYDPLSGSVLVFGGVTYQGSGSGNVLDTQYANDLLKWNGTNWVQLISTDNNASPRLRALPLMGSSPSTGQVILQGGVLFYYQTYVYYTDTYALQVGHGVNLGSANVCQAGAPAPCSQSAGVTFVFNTSVTAQGPALLTQGNAGTDFTDDGTGSCSIQANHTYAVGEGCTVNVVFTPSAPGRRTGVVNLVDSHGTLLATELLAGTGVAPLGLFTSPAATTVASGLNTPRGLSVDSQGNVFVSENSGAVLDKITPSGVKTQYATAANPKGTVVDGAGNLYFVASNAIYTIARGASSPTLYASPGSVSLENNLQIDKAGNLFVTSSSDFGLYEVPALTQNFVLVFAGGTAVTGGITGRIVSTAIDQNDTLYLADNGFGRVYTLTTGSTVPTTLLARDSYLQSPEGIAVDPAGNVYITLGNGSSLLRYSAPFANQAAAQVQVLSSYNGQHGAAIGADGTLYLISGNSVVKYVRATGPALPFYSVPNQTSSAQQLQQFENDGNAMLNLSVSTSSNNFAAAGAAYNGFPACGSTLAAAGSCGLGFTFTPKASGFFTANGIVTDNSLSGTQTIALSGTGTQGAQTITFPQPASATPGTTATLTATSSSGLPVTYAITGGTGSATLSGSNNATITYTSQGTVQITASQLGDANYFAASPVTVTVNVIPAPLSSPVGTSTAKQTATITFVAAGTPATINVVTQGVSGLDFAFSSGGTCSTAIPYTAGQTCTVQYTFTPRAPGKRLGAIVLRDSAGNILTASTLLSGTGTGPLALFTTPVASVLASGLSLPRGFTIDAAGNLYFNESDGGSLDKFTPAGVMTQYAKPNGTGGTAVDGAGNIFYGNADSIYEIAAGTTNSVLYATGIGNSENNLVVDRSGTLFVTDTSGNVWTVTAGSGKAMLLFPVGTTVSGGTTGRLVGTAVDANDNLYLADFDYNRVYRVAAGTSTPVTLLTTDPFLNNPYAMAVDAAGNIYIANYSGPSNIVRYNPPYSGGTAANVEQLATIGGSTALAVGSDGTIFSFGSGGANKYVRATSALAFGRVPVGSSSAQTVEEFENDGNTVLNIFSIAASDSNFKAVGVDANSFATACGSTLPAGGVCGLGLSFTPKTGGPHTGSGNVTDDSLNAAGSVQQVALSGSTQQAQTITFPQPATPAYLNASATLNATSTSGLPVSFAITGGTGSATLSGTNNATITYTGTGTVQITASQAGDQNNFAASSVTDTVTVLTQPATLRVTGYPQNSATGTAQTVTVTATDTSGQVNTSFTGSVTLTSSDVIATLPAAYTFVATDKGTHTFSVTLNTAGLQSVTSTSSSLTGSQTGILTTGFVLVLGNGVDNKLSTTGAKVWSTSGGTPASGVAAAATGQIFSLDTTNNSLIRYGRSNGNLQGPYTGGGLSSPTQLAIDGADSVWITNSTGSVSVFNNPSSVSSPIASAALSPASGYTGPYSSPTGIAIDISGNVWVANSGNNTITEILGGAAPVAPLSTSLTNTTTGVRP